MEKNKKKPSLNEIFLLIFILVCVSLVLIDMAINVKNEINMQSQGDTSYIPTHIAILAVFPTQLQITEKTEAKFALSQADQIFLFDEEWL